MPRPFKQLTLSQFAEVLNGFPFKRKVISVHMHHTLIPRKTDHRGVSTIESMFRFHTEKRGFNDIAQHLSIAPDGTVWTGRDWNKDPASAKGHNEGAFMFETIGNFDKGQEKLEGAQRQAVVEVIARVQLRCGLPADALRFHNEMTDEKTCPGTGIKKSEILAEVKAMRERLEQTTRDFALDAAPEEAAAGAVAAGSRGAGEPPFDARWEDGSEAAGRAFAAAEEEGDPDFDESVLEGAAAARGGGLPPELVAALRPHVVNLSGGRFSAGGLFRTTAADVEAIFARHLPEAAAEAAARGRPLRILFYAHGGLVSEESGLRGAGKLVAWWKDNGVYPIYFVWETGLLPTITQVLRGSRDATASRGFVDDRITDPALEAVARTLGGEKIWSGMKANAERSVRQDGGALFVAQRLRAFCDRHPGVELHAVGHSAGSIFHSYFVPAALAQEVPAFRSLHLLAPAIRTDAFMERLAPRVGDAERGIASLCMFTMNDAQERRDNCGGVYRKSLLYLVHRALERRPRDPVLGLEASVRADARLRRLFGLEGGPGLAEVVWSVTDEERGLSASRSTTHGGFDNDAPTMESVLRRVLGVDGDAEIRPFPEAAQRAFDDELGLEVDRALAAVDEDDSPLDDGREPTMDVVAPPTPPVKGRRPVKRALCVGINAYPDMPLSGCVADARLWARTFKGLGFQTELLLDREATRGGILAGLEKLVRESGPGDVLAFQFAGHGTQFRDRDGDRGRDAETDGKDEAIVPFDYTQRPCILDDEQFEVFQKLPGGVSLTCFYDCCHSGSATRAALDKFAEILQATMEGRSARGGGDDRPQYRFIDPTPEMWREYRALKQDRKQSGAAPVKRTEESLRWVAFSACRDDQLALEVSQEGARNGVFTRLTTPLLQAALGQQVANEAFFQRIQEAFGSDWEQTPVLEGARAYRSRGLLQPLAGRAAEVLPLSSGQAAGLQDRYRTGLQKVVEQLQALLDES